MLLNIFAFLCWMSGILGLVSMQTAELEEGYYSRLTFSWGLIVMGLIFLQLRVSQYKGGAPTIIAVIISFITLFGMVTGLENYVLYREYDSGSVIVYGLFTVIAIALYLTGHRMHRIQVVLDSRLEQVQANKNE